MMYTSKDNYTTSWHIIGEGRRVIAPRYIWDISFLSLALKILNKWEQSKLQEKKNHGSFTKVKKLTFTINL